ncbi:MAG: flavodoxin domain-containing protein [Lentisphaeria bacterium]|nr:flavodoxin domain-containing protein [Lentisphaeria bacterium]
MANFQAVKVTEKVWWVGAVDWHLREFHGYRTSRGTTYNAFLVLDEKVTLIDTVKAPFFEEMRERIASVIDPEKIDYIVSNHAEMDHSGCLPRAMREFKAEKLFCSMQGEKALKAHFHDALPSLEIVKTGDAITLGSNSLAFVETKMLHWPDSMVSYLTGEKVLFSQDAFGMHLAGSERFADEYSDSLLYEEAKKYFANILLLQSAKIIDLLNNLPGLNLDIDFVAPDHGPIWRNGDQAKILQLYREFAEQKPEKRAVVLFDTMWHSTEAMANAIAEGLIQSGIPTDIISLHSCERSEAITKIMGAGVLAAGTPTINNNMYPSLGDILTYMRGLKPKIAVGGAFGSFGWSGEGAKQVAEAMTQMNIEQPAAPLAVKYVPNAEALAQCVEFGKTLAEALKNKLQN